MRRFCFLLSVLFFASCRPDAKEEIVFEKDAIRIVSARENAQKAELSVEIADTNAKRARGLMYRTKMGDDEGMLFLFPVRKKVGMWMANTVMPLDMVFIDKSGVIKEIVENTVPFSHDEIVSNDAVSAVLEIKGGRAKGLNLKKGDVVRHSFFKLDKSSEN